MKTIFLLASSTMIDICVQCTYLPALFKTEAAILIRLYEKFITPCSESNTNQGKEKKTFGVICHHLRSMSCRSTECIP